MNLNVASAPLSHQGIPEIVRSRNRINLKRRMLGMVSTPLSHLWDSEIKQSGKASLPRPNVMIDNGS